MRNYGRLGPLARTRRLAARVRGPSVPLAHSESREDKNKTKSVPSLGSLLEVKCLLLLKYARK